MTDSDPADRVSPPVREGASRPGEERGLSPAARRALAEAEARRAAGAPGAGPRELNGRGGPDPARYGDWEVKGIASDF